MIGLVADLHLGKSLRKNDLRFINDSYEALNNLSVELNKNKITSVILAGDIFDTPTIHGKHIDAFKRFLDNTQAKVYVTQGNHDKGEYDMAVALGATSIHGVLTEIGGLKIYGLSWMYREQLQEVIKDVPACDLLVLHAPFKHLLSFEGAYDISIEDIPTHVKNVLVGDIHKKDIHKLPNGGYIVSPGSLHATALDQDKAKGFYTFDGLKWEGHIIPTRPIYRHTIETKEDLKDLSFKKSVLKPICELTYDVMLADDIDEFKKLNSNVDFLENLFRASSLDDLKDIDLSDTKIETLTDLLPFAIDSKERGFTLLNNLLTDTAKDPSKIIKEFLSA